jgi:type I restriction enzyme S subunit
MEPLQMNEKMVPELPENWVWTTIGDIVTFEYGKALRKDRRDSDGSIPVYGSNGIVGYHSIPLTNAACLIVGRKGAAGNVHISKVPCWPIDTTYYIASPSGVSLFFLYFLLSTLNLNSLDKSTAIPGLNRNDAYILNIPLPPLPEQHRIVTKVEELFTQLDAGVGALTNTKAQLKRYRQSVLKSACEGRLVPTEAELARAEGRDYEPADVLLARIGKERREKWDAEKKRKGKKSAKYKEPAAPDVSGLPGLPEGWRWGGIAQICQHIIDCLHSTPKFIQDGKYCIDTNCIEQGKIIFEKSRFVSEETYYDRVSRMTPQVDDILFAREGTIGTAVIVPPNIELCLGQRMMMFRAANGIIPLYFMLGIQSQIFEKQWKGKVTGSTVPHVNIGDLKLMALPLPPTLEQRRIVAEIERRISVADEIEKTIDQSLKQAERLRQSVLKKAFEGKLVPQDPNDEPAEKLLERIKQEKTKIKVRK